MKKIVVLILISLIMQSCSFDESPIEYPLNDGWRLLNNNNDSLLTAEVPGSVHMDLLRNGIIEDPFYRTNEAKLQWIDKEDWTYNLSFNVNEELYDKQNILLNFDGLDTYADVFLNDSLILQTNNMFVKWTIKCKPLLSLGENNLVIKFKSPTSEGIKKLSNLGYALPASNDQSVKGGLGNNRVSIFTRKAPFHYGWDWGPRFVTSGIWKQVYLKAWDNAIIEDVHISTKSLTNNSAEMKLVFEIESTQDRQIECTALIEDEIIFEDNLFNLKSGKNKIVKTFKIDNPKLWWTNGLGEQPLYTFTLNIHDDGNKIDSKQITFGIRTVEVVREKDSIGTSFYFKLNGQPVFMKGANYIPSDVFLSRVDDSDYKKIIKSAVDANMNMLRVWGGGIYEKDIFYDLCDEYGLLVWQDFMFACSMYPGDDEFLENVKIEAEQNVIRLRNHPSIALWCGNNEVIDAWNRWGWKKEFAEHEAEIWEAYENIFYKLLPSVITEYDSSRFYWPSSPGSDYDKPSELHSGDYHYWGVWHGLEPFEKFDSNIGRFMSEYGFQSFPQFSTVKKYSLPEDWDIESDVMKSHQRSGIGNLRIRDYTEMYFKEPMNFEMQLYVGQLLQAYGIEKAIHAHRRNKPFCMGTLYWQLNDCWPVASWSSTDYYRNWKALHYSVKKSYENILIAPFQNEDSVEVFIISDFLNSVQGNLSITLMSFSGDEIFSEKHDVTIEANSSTRFTTIELPNDFSKSDLCSSLLKIELVTDNKIISSVKHYFVYPKELNLEKASISITFENESQLKIKTDKFAKNVFIKYSGENGIHLSENYFDLLAGEEKIISLDRKISNEDLKRISVITLVDSYNQ